jgi:hypothetical protein
MHRESYFLHGEAPDVKIVRSDNIRYLAQISDHFLVLDIAGKSCTETE